MARKSSSIEDPMERIARLLAIIAVQEMPKEDAARCLLAAGFDATQIAGLLDVNRNFAHVAASRRKAKR